MYVHPRHSGRQVGADDRPAAQHGFQLHDPERFLTSNRRKHQRGARVQPRQTLFVGHFTRQLYPITETQLAHLGFQRATEWSVPYDHRLRLQARQRAEQDVESFVRHQPADK